MTLMLAGLLLLSQSLLLAHASDHALPGADHVTCQLCAHSPMAALPATAAAEVQLPALSAGVIGLTRAGYRPALRGIESIRGPPVHSQH